MYYACNPPVPLAAFIEKFWLYEEQSFAHFKERTLPQGRFELLINLHTDEIRVYDRVHHDQMQRLSGSIFRGTHSTFSIIDTAAQSVIMGVHFKVGGATPFLSIPASELHNQHVDLKLLWGSEAGSLYESLRTAEPCSLPNQPINQSIKGCIKKGHGE